MTAKVERLARPLRQAVVELAGRVEVTEREFCLVYAPRVAHLGFRLGSSDVRHRTAWALAAQWLVAYSRGAIREDASLAAAEEWFHGGRDELPRLAPPSGSLPQIAEAASRDEVYALLPYLLDPLAPATRRCVLKDESLLADRLARKAGGVYYTPADLAQLMANSALLPAARSCLDPACGSGVFLRAAVAEHGHSLRAFGCDTDPVAAELCAFVLLAAAWTHLHPPVAPWATWHIQRTRLATVDSLLLRIGTDVNEVAARARTREVDEVQVGLLDSTVAPPAEEHDSSPWLGTVFPELAEGADVLLTNPPYAALGDHPAAAEIAALCDSFREAQPTAAANVYPVFVEHGWRLTAPGRGRAAIVVPLSLAFSTGRHFRTLRRSMASQPGRWRLSFFDRTPDALFGDDVKTRNAVLVYAADEQCGVETTEVLRWTSRTRHAFLQRMVHVDLGDSQIDNFIPKVGGEHQASLYRAVRNLPGSLGASVSSTAKLPARLASQAEDEACVYVGPTAYNWLNCARTLRPWRNEVNLAESPLTCLRFTSAETADAAYAVLASRLAFWLWRVEGDAFHVSPRFLKSIPFALESLGKASRQTLAEAGRTLWETVADTPVVSVNKGRRTLGFHAQSAPQQLDTVDAYLLAAFALEEAGGNFDLPGWYETLILVDATERRRFSLVPGLRRE